MISEATTQVNDLPAAPTAVTPAAAQPHTGAVPARVRLCCPYCKAALDASTAENWRCPGCQRSFPVDGGIPDLRTFETYYGSRERERPAVRALLDAYPTATFAELIRVRFGPDYPLPEHLREHYANYRLENVKRGSARLVQASQYLAQAGRTLPESGAALEIGCGSGGMVATLARHFTAVAGIDINMVDLILAKKLAEELGLTNVTLACACAEALPFPTATFGYIEALDVIEHVAQQAAVLAEADRVLDAGGVFWFTSPNRFYLFGPERHVLVWGVGFVPRRWQNAYVKFRKGIEYRGKRLLSRAELIRLLREAGVKEYTLIEPDPIVNTARPPRSRWGKFARERTPWLVPLANRGTAHFGSEFRVVVTK
jgi:ubiquinone/menaquinone biosynthesis C-methylase UbiE/uncharacterized protein YbaR (Trm112 family)